MTGVLKQREGVMSDDDNPSSIFGAIISALILVAIWPYLLALLGIYFAYMMALAILEWMAEHWILISGLFCVVLAIYGIFRYRLIGKAWSNFFSTAEVKPTKVELSHLPERSWVPSTNLYCYWCTRKLGIQAWKKDGKYVCQECHDKGLS